MSRNIPTNYSLLALFVMSLGLVLANADVQCIDVIMKLMPCQGFLMSGDASPSVECCTGAQSLDKQLVSDQPDRQAICSCIKSAAQTVPINLDKAAMLPDLCKLASKIPVDPNVDCSTV